MIAPAQVVLAALALVPAAVVPAAMPFVEVQVPKNDGWVTDLAGMLSAQQEDELERLMESYKQGSTHEIALLTVESLRGEPLERFALEVARVWGLGREGVHNGALLLVAKNDRKIRIEVGRGLEGTLTDSISGRIIRDVITPEFKAGRFAEGLRRGIEAIHAAAGGDYAGLPKPRPQRGPARTALPGLFWLAFFFLFLILGAVRGGRRRRRGGLAAPIFWGSVLGSSLGRRGGGFGGGRGFGGGGFSGFGGGGGFSGGGASGGW